MRIIPEVREKAVREESKREGRIAREVSLRR